MIVLKPCFETTPLSAVSTSLALVSASDRLASAVRATARSDGSTASAGCTARQTSASASPIKPADRFAATLLAFNWKPPCKKRALVEVILHRNGQRETVFVSLPDR